MFRIIPKVRFKSTCPSRSHKCQSNLIEHYWTHANCGGDLYLDNRAMLTCDRGDAEDYIFNWKFICGYTDDGAHKAGFEKGCFQSFLACISSLGKLKNPPKNFIFQVTQILMQHKDEFYESYENNDYY